jgi:AcrR family transcriptional regulator
MDPQPDMMRSTGAPSVREPAAAGRGLLLAVARRRFLAEGYAAASMAGIASDAGVTKAALYYHFPGKEALFVAVCAAEAERVQAGLQAIAAAGGALADMLVAVADYAFREAGDGAVRLLDELGRHVDPAVQEIEFADRLSPIDVLVRIIAERRHEVRNDLDPVLLAETFFAMVMSQMQDTNRRPGSDPIGPDLARRLVDIFVNGAMAR